MIARRTALHAATAAMPAAIANPRGRLRKLSAIPARARSLAGAALSLRRRRTRELPSHLFGEPAWDMLLDLFVRTLDSRLTSVSSACLAADVPPTTALRCLARLDRAGLIRRRASATDQRVRYVELTEEGLLRMARVLMNEER